MERYEKADDDVQFQIEQKQHPRYQRAGDDLFYLLGGVWE